MKGYLQNQSCDSHKFIWVEGVLPKPRAGFCGYKVSKYLLLTDKQDTAYHDTVNQAPYSISHSNSSRYVHIYR